MKVVIHTYLVVLLSLVAPLSAVRLRAPSGSSSSAAIGSNTAMGLDVDLPGTPAPLPEEIQRLILRLRDGASMEQADEPGEQPYTGNGCRLGRTVNTLGRIAVDE